jgi:hypothetical protein
MVKTMDEERRVFGYCEECGAKITDDIEEYYCDDDGNLFCSHECVLEHFGLYKVEV